MNKTLLAIATLFSLSASLPAMADTLRVAVGEKTSNYTGSLPLRGQTKDQVESQYGPANSTHGPSGNPPIYYWEYAGFTVYFESEYVIHAVLKSR